MALFDFGRRRRITCIAVAGAILLLFNLFFLTGNDIPSKISHIPIPEQPVPSPLPHSPPPPTDPNPIGDTSEVPPDPKPIDDTPKFPPDDVLAPESMPQAGLVDSHPIVALIEEADQKWQVYESSRSTSFRQTVENYRAKYGRHPPPKFREWYKFARKKNVFNIDDFDQIIDDLRPFWAIKPAVLRQHAAHLWEDEESGISGIHIRRGKVADLSRPCWRSETLKTLIEKFVKYLPDMDVAMNRLDQPRLAVPWDDMQEYLTKERQARYFPPEVFDGFTPNQMNLRDLSLEDPAEDKSERLDAGWIPAPGRQYMEIARESCPPESPARTNMSISDADALYKLPQAGIVSNFNLSSDLCTVGPTIQNAHGFLFSPSSIVATKELLPIFSECKVSVNSDILFPANMYWKHDERYDYSDAEDLPWEQKSDKMIWRGVTSGGVQIPENWSMMHRQRLVQLMNGTRIALDGKQVTVLTRVRPTSDPAGQTETAYENFGAFDPASFATNHTDVGFVEAWGCIPEECPFYADVFSWKPSVPLTAQFRSKYLIDVDGHSFSGRWRAFLESRSLAFKATIFREWHDSRLFAWRHFVPVDNRYEEIYTLLTYFIGYGTDGVASAEMPESLEGDDDRNAKVYMPRHDEVAKQLAMQGREWAQRALRREDMEVYMFRLLIEYARIVDDNRDRIGYSGDGSELDKFDDDDDGDGLLGSFWGLGRLWGGKGEKEDGVGPPPSGAEELGDDGPLEGDGGHPIVGVRADPYSR